MSARITIIDYGLGNLFSVVEACKYWGYNTCITNSANEVEQADFVILPGVGAFADAMNNLSKLHLDEAINNYLKKGNHLMGICLGHQLLFTESHEFEVTKGLGLIQGIVKKFPNQIIDNERYKVPQIQWNEVRITQNFTEKYTPLNHVSPKEFFYFIHSFYTQIESDHELSLTKTSYGNIDFTSSVLRENVFSCQFHPEKSGMQGLKIYDNWIKYAKNE
jgi:glutamine amidotransferase